MLLATATASNTASFDWALPPGFARFRIEVEEFQPITDAKDIALRVSTDGGSNYADSSYLNSTMWNTIASHNHAGAGETTLMYLCLVGQANDHGTQTLMATLYGTEAGQYPRLIGHGAMVNIDAALGQGANCAEYNGSTDRVTHIRLLCSSGNIGTGTFYLFGEA